MNEMKFMSRYIGEPIEHDIYEKIAIFYNAKCELYDRGITDKRDRYDETCAYIVTQEQRNLSNNYSNNLRKIIEGWYIDNYHENFDFKRLNEWNRKLNRHKVQYVVDMFHFFVDKKNDIICELNKLI